MHEWETYFGGPHFLRCFRLVINTEFTSLPEVEELIEHNVFKKDNTFLHLDAMVGITKFSHNILYIVGTVKKPLAIPAYIYLCLTMSHHLFFWVPDTQHPGRSHASTTKASYKSKSSACSSRLPKGQQKSFGLAAHVRREGGLCLPATAAGGCLLLLLMLVPEEVAVLRSPGLLQRFSFPVFTPSYCHSFFPILGPFPGPS